MNVVAAPARLVLPLRPLFIATILLGSFLLFLIQPMFGRSVLPMLGGAPAVWNTAMLFYQVTLLLGYLYAHAVRRLPLSRQLALHLALFALAALTLPVGVAGWVPAAGDAPPVLWLLGLLAASIGPIFFVVSAQAPLMQSWFARSRHPDAANPYFLYAASNIGSFAALIAYPLAMEPTMALGNQALLWSVGFVVLALLVALAGLSVIRDGGAPLVEEPAVPVTWAQRGRWTLLSFIASALLLSTTTHLTTDIMAMPLLWVLPLGVYLLTFILAFGTRGAWWTALALRVAPLLLLMAGAWACLSVGPVTATVFAVMGILLLFVIALAMHGTLALEKPEAGALTDFYLWISVGGALGGVLCALIAPVIFDWAYEHPLLLVAAAALIPGRALLPSAAPLRDTPQARWAIMALAAVIMLLVAPSVTGKMTSVAESGFTLMSVFGMLVLALLVMISAGRATLFAWCFAMLLLGLGGWAQLRTSATEFARERSFFGIYTVNDLPTAKLRLFQHGTTTHGVQSLDPARAREPMTYYTAQSGIGIVMRQMPQLFGPGADVAFLGLGAGTLACFSTPDQRWTAYEIDPVVVDIARRSFTYIRECNPAMRIVLGDGRLTLAAAPAASYDLLAVDAFASDSVPLHLITREAFGVYARAIKTDGVLMIHISNRFLDLEPVVAAIGAAEGFDVHVRKHFATKRKKGEIVADTVWVLLTRSPERLAQIKAASPPGAWQKAVATPGAEPWTDDFASIVPVLRLRQD